MPDQYFVNKVAQSNGEHEVHTLECKYLPSIQNRIELGEFYTCRPAVTEAKKYYTNSNGCFFCSRPCHTG